MYKVGLSINPMEGVELYHELKEAGFECVEISRGLLELAEQADFKQVARNAKESGISLWSFHLPFGAHRISYDISLPLNDIRKKVVETNIEFIKKASDIGITKMVIHPSRDPIDDGERAERMKCSKESLGILAEAAEKCGAIICVEVMSRTRLGRNSHEMLELLSADSRLKMCFDTNHLLKEDMATFIRKTGKYMVTTHVSDNDLVDEKHWLPGEGLIDWNMLCSELKEVGYAGAWIYEGIGCPPDRTRSRQLTWKDVYKNAQAIFAGEKPEII